MINCNQVIKCKLDGKQSLSVPISLKKNGRYLTDPITILVQGFLKFNDIYSNGDTNYSVSSINDRNSLEDKTIVYPVLFSSESVTIYNGKGTITLLPRSEDLLYDYETLNKRLNSNYNISNNEKLNIENTKIVIQTGQIRSPYKISIYVSIVDEILYGNTIDYICEDNQKDTLWEKYEKKLSSNLLIECYNEDDWVPYVEKLNLDNNNGLYDEVISIIENTTNETPFGLSPMYDAISLSANILSDNSINDIRKVIYVIADNEVNSSIKTVDEMIEDVNSIDGDKKTPIIFGNICTSNQKTLSSKANSSDTKIINKICYLTGGQGVSIVSDSSKDEALSIFYGETVGSMGYGEFSFIVDMEEEVIINSIESIFEIPDVRNSANWKVSFSLDGYSFEDYKNILTKDEKIENFNRQFRYIKFTIILLTGFSFDEYFSIIEYPFLKNIIISYNNKKVSYLYLSVSDNQLSPSQVVIGVDSNINMSENIKVGVALSDSHNWDDFSNDSRKIVNQNGKIFVPLRFSDREEEYKEKLIRVGRFAFKTSYGGWDKDSSVTVYDENNEIIPSGKYEIFYREGLVVFNYVVDNDYITGDYKISILNTSKYKIGLELTNSSKDSNLEVYGIGVMYSTGSDFLPPIEKVAPQVSNILISNIIPGIYDKIEVQYTYFDSNYDEENISLGKIKWYINNIHIPYLDNLKEWNDISNINDPLFRFYLSFSISDLVEGQTVQEKARENGESILKVGDFVFCTVQVSDGNLLSEIGKSNIVKIIESKPYISGLKLNSIAENGKILERLSSNNTVFVSFNFIADIADNKSEIVWFINGSEFKRGTWGSGNFDRILPGEVSPNSLDLGLLMGNDIYVRVTPKTSSSVGEPIISDLYVIKNSYPVISNVIIIPTVPNESQDMILSWDFFDFEINALKDPNQINSSIIKWYRKNPGGTTFSEVNDSVNIITVLENNNSTVRTAILSHGQQWYATLTPNDGIDNGSIITTNIITIGKRK